MSIREKMSALLERVTTDKLVSSTGLEEIVSQIMTYYNQKIKEVKKEVISQQEVNEILNKLN